MPRSLWRAEAIMDREELKKIYPQVLRKYLFEGRGEEALYTAYELGEQCFEAKISLEDIIALHTSSLEELIKGLPLDRVPEVMLRSSDLLVEFTVRFSLACQHYAEMLKRTDERIRKAFYQAGETLTAGLDTQKVLSSILGLVKNLTDAKACDIMLWEDGRFIIKAEEGLAEGWIPEAEGLPAYRAMEERVPKFIPDTKEQKTGLPRLKTGDTIRSLISLPIEVKGEVLGVMEIYLGQPHVFEKGEVELLMSFARQAGAAIDSSRLFSKLQRHHKTLEALYAIDRVVSQTLNLDTIFRDALSKALEVTETDSGIIYLLEEDGETLGLKAHLGLSEELARAVSKLKVGEGVSGMAVRSGQPVSLGIEKYPSPELLPHLVKDGIVSIASSPLLAKGKALGAMTLNRRHRSFSQDDLDLLASIGSQIGVAVENARLFSELRRRVQMIECLYDIDRVVSKSLDLEEVLKSALTKAMEVINADSGSLHLLDEKGENLILKTYSGLLSKEFVSIISKLKMGEGVTGRAAKMQKPETLDIAHYPSFDLLPHLEKEGIVSLASTPLVAKGKVLGAMTFTNRRYRIFSQDDLDLLDSIGDQIGVAIENARLFSELQRHDKTLEALYAIDRVVSQTLDLDTIFRDALSKAMEVTETEAGGIYLLEEDGGTLSLKTHLGLSSEFVRAVSKLKVGQGVAGMAVQSGKPVTIDIERYPSPELLASLVKEGIVSVAGIPLIAKGKVVGAMNLVNRRHRFFSKDDLDLLASIGSQTGIAVENARLYQEVREKAEHISALYRIARAVKASLDIGEVFDAMVDEMRKILSFDRTSINLLKEEVLEVFALAEDVKIPELGRGTKIPREKSSCGLILDRGIGLIRSLDKETPFYEDPILFRKGIRSVIQVPLISKGERIGVFSLESCRPESYTQRDLGLAQAIADQIATSIENVRLYEDLKQASLELEKRLKELEEFHELAIGRELRMIELKERVRSLEGK